MLDAIGTVLRETRGVQAFWKKLTELGITIAPESTDEELVLQDSEGKCIRFFEIWPPFRSKSDLEALVRPGLDEKDKWIDVTGIVKEAGFEPVRVDYDWLKWRAKKQAELFHSIKAALPRLEELLKLNSADPEMGMRDRVHWFYEDMLYRFWHRSVKVLYLQKETQEMADALQDLMPKREMDPMFLQILKGGTERKELTYEESFESQARPICEAYFHTRYILEMAVKYARLLDAPPASRPSGWAAVLEVFCLR